MGNPGIGVEAGLAGMDPDGPFLTTREAALRLGVALRTAQLWVESGALPAWKTVGGHRRIPLSAVEAMRASRVVCATRGEEPFRLLVVEDDAEALRLFETRLAGWGLPLRLRTASDGFEALPLVSAWKPHLLVTDLSMPGMDGIRMIRSLRRHPATTRLEIVVVTALGAEEIAARGGLPGGTPVLAKPIPFDRLEALVRARIGPGSERSAASPAA